MVRERLHLKMCSIIPKVDVGSSQGRSEGLRRDWLTGLRTRVGGRRVVVSFWTTGLGACCAAWLSAVWALCVAGLVSAGTGGSTAAASATALRASGDVAAKGALGVWRLGSARSGRIDCGGGHDVGVSVGRCRGEVGAVCAVVRRGKHMHHDRRAVRGSESGRVDIEVGAVCALVRRGRHMRHDRRSVRDSGRGREFVLGGGERVENAGRWRWFGMTVAATLALVVAA